MKKRILNIILGAAFAGCVCWAAAAPGLLAWMPMILAVILCIALLDMNSNYIREI